MKRLLIAERICLIGHVFATLFGLAGLLVVLPNPDLIGNLPPFGLQFFGWSMAGGGIAYIVLGTAAVALYAFRTLGGFVGLSFLLPAVVLSLSSELLGTSTGFPFGDYQYLSGLGYKIAGLVPFTIPLSWFYLGLSAYLLARAGLSVDRRPTLLRHLAAIALGAVLLTAWDLVLDPAMSQTPYPFWQFQQAGSFFGMPYRNLTGWLATGTLFMSVAALLWRKRPIVLWRDRLVVPLIVYLTNFSFGAAITLVALDNRFWIPTLLGLGLGAIPAVVLWRIAAAEPEVTQDDRPAGEPQTAPSPANPVEMAAK